MWRNTIIGYVYVAMGVVYVMPALMCLSVLIGLPVIQNSSYKMLWFISFLDVLNITACCFFAGFYSLTGADYLNTPSMLTVGSITLACWVSYCAMNVILGIDRVFCFCSARWYRRMFSGVKAFVWIGLAVLAGVQMLMPFDGEQFYHYDSTIGGWRFELKPRGNVSLTEF
uniref:7TM_GPCR_Srx domain-containing protein n=1 Tax=Steinernema glaseri TaxID=37863 RepID=A0A1I7ZS32_9BILA